MTDDNWTLDSFQNNFIDIYLIYLHSKKVHWKMNMNFTFV